MSHTPHKYLLQCCVLALLAAGLTLAGCDSGGEAASVSGHWQSLPLARAFVGECCDLTLDLAQEGRTITGVGELRLPGERPLEQIIYALSVDGIHNPPRLSLTLRSGVRSGTFSGEIEPFDVWDQGVEGTLAGFGVQHRLQVVRYITP